jgi:O-antigen chain-terminating methyltransferase
MSTNDNGSHRGTLIPAEVGVETLSRVLSDEIARHARNGSRRHGTNGHEDRSAVDWARIASDLELAETNAHVGTTLPELTRFRGVKRKVAQFVARGVMYLSRVITNRQRQYNLSVLSAVRDLVSGLRRFEEEQRRRFHDVVQPLEQQLSEQVARLRQQEQSLSHARAGLIAQERRLNVLIEEVRRRLAGPLDAQHARTFAAEADHATEAMYIALEDQFRGSREEIKERLQAYLPYLEEAQLREGDVVLDVGCGRGEWLELMRERGVPAHGIETNRVLVEQGRGRGLDVRSAEGLDYLRSLPDGSVAVLTAFHVLEHLPLPVLLAFLDETTRVLRPGGLAIFETPNPENIVVGSCNFYIDPTHQKPLFPGTIQFLVEQRGLVRVELLRLSAGRCADPVRLLPDSHALAPYLNPVLETFKMRFFAPPDLGIIGRKAR